MNRFLSAAVVGVAAVDDNVLIQMEIQRSDVNWDQGKPVMDSNWLEQGDHKDHFALEQPPVGVMDGMDNKWYSLEQGKPDLNQKPGNIKMNCQEKDIKNCADKFCAGHGIHAEHCAKEFCTNIFKDNFGNCMDDLMAPDKEFCTNIFKDNFGNWYCNGLVIIDCLKECEQFEDQGAFANCMVGCMTPEK